MPTGTGKIKHNFKNFTSFKNFELKDLFVPAAIIVISLLLFLVHGQLIVATVNGSQISRLTLISELEKKDGKTVLETLVTERLILQEADRRTVTVSDSEVKGEIANIEKSVSKQGQNLDTLLSQQGMTRNDLLKQVKIQLLLKKIVGGISVTDKEVNDYIDKNKDSLPSGTDPATLKPQIKKQLEQQKINDKIQKLISDLQSKAKIDYLLKL
jgi:foldase protein PrsA